MSFEQMVSSLEQTEDQFEHNSPSEMNLSGHAFHAHFKKGDKNATSVLEKDTQSITVSTIRNQRTSKNTTNRQQQFKRIFVD